MYIYIQYITVYAYILWNEQQLPFGTLALWLTQGLPIISLFALKQRNRIEVCQVCSKRKTPKRVRDPEKKQTTLSRVDLGFRAWCFFPKTEKPHFRPAMSWTEVNLNTLEGGVFTVEVPVTATVRELKRMLIATHPCEDLIERKVLRVELLLGDRCIIEDANTLEAAGLLDGEALVTVTYTRNEVETATLDDVHTQGYFGVKIPSELSKIGEGAFSNSDELVWITIPESVTHIGNYAFAGCSSLERITMSESVTHIGDCAFAWCRSLPEIRMGESMIRIGDAAFEACQSLKSITMGENVTHIGEEAFLACIRLTSIAMGESVIQVGSRAFRDCSALKDVTMGKSVTRIENSCFDGCKSLDNMVIGESVTHIGDGAFSWCSSFTSITIGESVTHIGEEAFASCISLTSIKLGESVLQVGSLAFRNCSSLENVTFGESVTHIGEDAFEGCSSLVSITIPETSRYLLGREGLSESLLAKITINCDLQPPTRKKLVGLAVSSSFKVCRHISLRT